MKTIVGIAMVLCITIKMCAFNSADKCIHILYFSIHILYKSTLVKVKELIQLLNSSKSRRVLVLKYTAAKIFCRELRGQIH